MQIESDVILAPYTTFGIGGKARYLARANTVEDIKEAYEFAKKKYIPTYILGGGSNILVPDGGLEALVLKIELKGIERKENTLIASAGEIWDALVERAIDEKLSGVENLSGIPGSVGGAVAGSIGAYGQAIAQTISFVEIFDSNSGEVRRMNNSECAFGYRESFFSRSPHIVILRAGFELSSEPQPNLSYKDLKERFEAEAPSLEAIRDAILAIRASKFPDLALEGTAGSFFKNPILSDVEASKLKEKYPDMPLFDMPETAGKKIPLAWLLDRVLALKGTRVGGARLYEKQPLVIVAQKNTSSHDVAALAALVKEKVKKECSIDIEEEVKII